MRYRSRGQPEAACSPGSRCLAATLPVLTALPAHAQADGAGTGTWLWYVLLSAAFIVALALVYLAVMRWGRPGSKAPGARAPSSVPVLAFLEAQDGSNDRFAITRSAFRIGRHSDNDFSIRDESISRQHAEIHRKRDGSFSITDLDSMNGVFVNQAKIDSATLQDGDIIEIGDRTYRFKIEVFEPPTGTDTAALKVIKTADVGRSQSGD